MLTDRLHRATQKLEAAGCESPRLDAEVLLAHLLGCERHALYLSEPPAHSETDLLRFERWVERRAQREPVAYITGLREFWSLPIRVNRHVLIPRPETEAVVETALRIGPGIWGEAIPEILDLCCGSGCIAAALAKEWPSARITVSDLSPEALSVAKENLAFAGPRIHFIQSNLFENICGTFHLVVSNPPYIPSALLNHLQPEVRDYEPLQALDGGPNGLAIIDRIRENVFTVLKRGGALILENGARVETAWKS